MPLRSEEPHLSFCYGEQSRLLTLAHTLVKFLDTTPLTHLNIYTAKFLATLDDVRVPFVRNGCNNFSGIGFATPTYPNYCIPTSADTYSEEAPLTIIMGNQYQVKNRWEACSRQRAGRRNSCVCLTKHSRWAGGGGEGALGAGSERENGAAEGGWGLRGCSLGPLRWITAGDPFLSPEYVQCVRAGSGRLGE
ncbi:hypothetical protein B0H14DRAFT_2587502 [Mycena olivaceomarginata]|nr:hypothetical protein B0H14DRAFT_2587502 [Mycena olivaceomarginata]